MTTTSTLNAADDVAACGPVAASTAQLTDPRAFKHQPHPLAKHAEAFASYTDFDGAIWELTDRVWRFLVTSQLLPELETPVHLVSGSYNSAFARFIDGLTGNEDRLDYHEVVIAPDVVAAAFTGAAAGALPSNQPEVPRRSTLTDGIGGLVNRRVEISFLGSLEPLLGRVVAVHSDSLVVVDSENVTVVPLSVVGHIATWQMTEDEVSAAL